MEKEVVKGIMNESPESEIRPLKIADEDDLEQTYIMKELIYKEKTRTYVRDISDIIEDCDGIIGKFSHGRHFLRREGYVAVRQQYNKAIEQLRSAMEADRWNMCA